MKLVVYNGNDGRVLLVEENLISPVVSDNGVSWAGGFVDSTDSFILLENDVEVGNTVTEELLAKDHKTHFWKVNEAEELRSQLAETNALLLDFLESTV